MENNNKYTAKKMIVQELKEKLNQLNLPCKGRKEDLMRVCTDINLPTTKKVRNRKRDISTSVYHVLSNCLDFKNKKSQMQYVLKDKLGVSLRMTPKCHLGIAGQVIEYAWGYAKLRFSKNFNNAQASNLEKNVREALS